MNPAGWMPHGMCIRWDPAILTMRVIGDGVTALSYFSIPATIIFLRAHPVMSRLWPVLFMFSLFICFCGLTHVFDIITIWWPIYLGDAVMRLLTGAVSLATAIGLWRIAPGVLRGGDDDV